MQSAYSRVAWAVVLATLVVSLAARWNLSVRRAWIVAAVLAALTLMLGQVSPAYWLGLAGQQPSLLMAVLSALLLRARWAGHLEFRPLPLPLAVVLCVAGLLLYADCVGWIAVGIYTRGFGPVLPPTVAVVLAVGAALVIARHAPGSCERAVAAALACTLAVFALTRLPTGNLWDVVLDPL